MLAATALGEFEKADTQAGAKRNIKSAIEQVASRLGNTPTICRKCYVHPEILSAYLDGDRICPLKQDAQMDLSHPAALRPEEAALLALLNRRLCKDLKEIKKAA